ncbi:ABC transporter, partial [Enterococcus faecium]|nr:ABC transporter [Enterococcus faecium]
MKQSKQKQSRRLLFRLFLLICIVVGLLIALYPFYVDSLNSFIDIICQIKRDKTFHLRNSKKLLMVFGN